MSERNPQVVGARIAKLRHQKDLTQVQLAHALGVSPSTVADWERGHRFPARKLGKIEAYFGQPVDYDTAAAGPAPEPRPSPEPDDLEVLEQHLTDALERVRLQREKRKGASGAENRQYGT